ncbi:MAG: class II glutamine amidotransferase [Kofleriaceae bacterium]
MLGMAAARPTSVCELLYDAPRSLRVLSEHHADGWGVALRRNDTWTVKRSTTCAARCASYAGLDHEAVLAIAHIRKKTVGELSLANTHPFQRGRFVFAHNGTVDAAALAAHTAPEHTATLAGSTDSEQLFMFVLTQIDRAGEVAAGVTAAVRALHALGSIGSASFLLSCGDKLYAHRLGRALFTTQRRGVALIASEPLTDNDRWTEIGERELVVLERPQPSGMLAA